VYISPKERVYLAAAHEETDIVPYNISINPRLNEKLLKVYGDRFLKLSSKIINHFLGLSFKAKNDIPPLDVVGNWEDDFGCVWCQSLDGAPYVIKPAFSEPHIKGFEFPDYSLPELYTNIPLVIDKNRDKFIIGSISFVLFERSWAMRGFQQILIDFHKNPRFVEELYDKLTEINLDAVDRLVKFDIDAVCFGDDYGMQKGLLMGPRNWRTFIKPRLKRLYERVKKAGKLVMIHSCGDNSDIMGDFIDLGVDIFNPTQPEAMNIYDLKRKWGSQITFNGCIPSQKLPFFSPKKISEEVRRIRAFMSKDGGFILEPTKELRWDVPTETAIALIEEIVNPLACL
jgi:uroporphyrinogen decarboxylase